MRESNINHTYFLLRNHRRFYVCCIFKLPKYLLWGREIKKNWPLEANTGQKKRFLLKKKTGGKEEKEGGVGSGEREERRKEKEDAIECGTGE